MNWSKALLRYSIVVNKTILHLDLDTFFVSVERRINPELQAKPLLVGGITDRGVVAACSYETRGYGIHSGMPMKMAKELCPEATVIKGNAGTYSKVSDEVTEIIKEAVPLFEKSSIDELPQFFNVFLGDMSVVGPRPHAIPHNEEYQKKIDRFIQRHAVKPGITGLAQAKGYRGETSQFSAMYGRVKLDRFYVKNWSLILDLKIIILTVYSIVKGQDTAY